MLLGGGAGNPGGVGVSESAKSGINGTGGLLVVRASSYNGTGILTSCGSNGGEARRAGTWNAGGRSVQAVGR